MEVVLQVAAVGVVLGLAWLGLRPRYRFVVRIEDGVPRLAEGKATAAFLKELAQVCADAGVRRGWVGCTGRRSLSFSRDIPPGCQQRLRNLWQLHR
jgi:Protein of unknown function (DUF3634)